jgi:F0F1-type ATP synthase assembly protein I
MKFLPTPTSARRHLNGDDALGQGMEAALMIAVFLGIGWLLDRWLDTTPWFMLGLVVFAAIGVFVTMKVRYTARMEVLEQERLERAGAHRHGTGTSPS